MKIHLDLYVKCQCMHFYSLKVCWLDNFSNTKKLLLKGTLYGGWGEMKKTGQKYCDDGVGCCCSG